MNPFPQNLVTMKSKNHSINGTTNFFFTTFSMVNLSKS